MEYVLTNYRGPHILLRNGRRANRTLIFCIIRLRLGITANTKRSVLSVPLINMGAGSVTRRHFQAVLIGAALQRVCSTRAEHIGIRW